MAIDGKALTSVSDLRKNASALRNWMNSVSEQQREAMGFMGGGYGVERAAQDALDCAFRIASSVIAALEHTADALEHLAQTIEPTP